ncbi:hypothetical protein FDZ71_02215 [bacterium]|nr:MAG: hypothetical protein FDZ71_02215 [bacterium]
MRETTTIPALGDFYTYWAAAKYTEKFQSPAIYAENGKNLVKEYCSSPESGIERATSASAARRPASENTQTPLLYALTSAFTTLEYGKNVYWFKIISLLMMVAVSIASFRFWDYGLDEALILFSFQLLVFKPLTGDLYTDNINSVQWFLLMAILLAMNSKMRWRDFFAGFSLCFLLLIKPNIFLVPLFLLISRIAHKDWRRLRGECIGAAAGLAAGIGLGGYFFGSVWVWKDWAFKLASFPVEAGSIEALNFALPVILKNLTGSDLSGAVLVIGLALASFRIWLLASKNMSVGQGKDGDGLFDLQLIAAGMAGFLIFSKIAWYHYYTMLLPMIYLMLSKKWREAQSKLLNLATLAVISIFAIYSPQLPVVYTAIYTYLIALYLFIIGTSRPVSA